MTCNPAIPPRRPRSGGTRPRSDRALAPRRAARPVGRGPVIRLALWVLLAAAAPTAGDIGSCSQPIEELDPVKFFLEKDRVDCEQCVACGFQTRTCDRACAEAPSADSFEPGCYPLAHDGEVCLRALGAADCEEYADYIADEAPATPTECNFCPPGQRPEDR